MKLKYNKNINIIPFDNLQQLSFDLETYLKPGNIALSGGSTYLKLLKIWANKNLNLENVNFYPVDERVVDFENEDSNWGNTYRNFLSKYNINKKNHYIDYNEYNNLLKSITMDTIFLGVGDDGHTASLFSSDAIFKDSDKNAIGTISPKPPINRVSMTGEYIISAKNIIIIFLGEGKDYIVKKVLDGDELPITTLLKKVKRGIIYIHEPLLGDKNE